jgi:hypothetical protein
MKIDVPELKKVCDALFSRLIAYHGVHTIDVADSFYWKIDHAVAFDLSKEPASFQVGNLADDWAFIHGLADGTKQAVVYQLTELAPILDYIGEVVGLSLGGAGG